MCLRFPWPLSLSPFPVPAPTPPPAVQTIPPPPNPPLRRSPCGFKLFPPFQFRRQRRQIRTFQYGPPSNDPLLKMTMSLHGAVTSPPPESDRESPSSAPVSAHMPALAASPVKQDLTAHPLAAQSQACNFPAAILTILQDQVDRTNQSRSSNERLRKWLNLTINILYAFSVTLGEGVGLAFSPANVIFAGVGALLLAAKDVYASQDLLIDIFERIQNFFRRLEIYTKVTPTPAMTDMMANIMVEVLDILVIATKEMKQSRAK
ncbi:hypothetical protein EDB89DRAFT_2192984, partial [Lactarius sanguifluus]